MDGWKSGGLGGIGSDRCPTDAGFPLPSNDTQRAPPPPPPFPKKHKQTRQTNSKKHATQAGHYLLGFVGKTLNYLARRFGLCVVVRASRRANAAQHGQGQIKSTRLPQNPSVNPLAPLHITVKSTHPRSRVALTLSSSSCGTPLSNPNPHPGRILKHASRSQIHATTGRQRRRGRPPLRRRRRR